MLGRIKFPPKGLAEAFCLTADAFQIIEVFGRNFFKDGAKVRHRHRREAVIFPRIIQMAEKEPHQLTALGLAFAALGCFDRLLLNIGKNVADRFHIFSIPCGRMV